MKTRVVSLVVATVLLIGVGTASTAPDGDGDAEFRKVLGGLKAGIAALKAIDRHDEAKRLEQIATEWIAELRVRKAREAERRSGEHKNRERDIVKGRMHTLRVAMKGLMEVEAIDAAERCEHRLHAYELILEGRRDEEAMRIRESAPKPEAMVDPLRRAAKAWAEFGKEENAKRCIALAVQYKEIANREANRKKGGAERETVKRHLEILRIAHHGFREAEKKDAGHRIEQVIHIYELSLEGKHEAAAKARGKAPNAGQLAELLLSAGEIWNKFGHEKKARACFELGRFYQLRWKDQQAGRRKTREGSKEVRPDDRDRRIADLERQMGGIVRHLEEMNRNMHEMLKELQRLKREK